MEEWINKIDPITCIQKLTLDPIDINRLKEKDGKGYFMEKRAGVAILLSAKIYSKLKMVKQTKTLHTDINNMVNSSRIFNNYKHILIQQYNSKIHVPKKWHKLRQSQYPLSIMDRTSKHMNKNTEDLNNTINQLDVTDT